MPAERSPVDQYKQVRYKLWAVEEESRATTDWLERLGKNREISKVENELGRIAHHPEVRSYFNAFFQASLGVVNGIGRFRTHRWSPERSETVLASEYQELFGETILSVQDVTEEQLEKLFETKIKDLVLFGQVKNRLLERQFENLFDVACCRWVDFERMRGIGERSMNELKRLFSNFFETEELSLITLPVEPNRRKRWQSERVKQFNEQVKALRDEDLRNGEIAERLGVEIYRVQLAVQTLLAAGEIERRSWNKYTPAQLETLKDRVKNLRDEGLGNQEIAKRLEVPLGRVATAVNSLLNEGKIGVRRRGRPPRIPEEWQELKEKVKNLRDQGMGNEEIAARLEVPRGRVTIAVNSLLNEGKIEKRKHQGRSPEDVQRFNEQIIALRKQNLNTNQIAERLAVPLGRVTKAVNSLLGQGLIERKQRYRLGVGRVRFKLLELLQTHK